METKERKRPVQPVVFSMGNDQCVWGKAGVIKPTKCVNAFDCLGCAVDSKILASFDEQRKVSGQSDRASARLQLMMTKGKCRHMLTGRISYGLCSYAYNCARCPYDQMIEDTSYLPNLRKPTVDRASGFGVARDYYYHHGHTWARVEYGGRVRVGIDDFALRLLGPQDEIKMPALGSTVGQNRPSAILKRSRNEAPTMSPIDGEIVAINHNILSQASAANDSPYSDGWLMVVQPKSLRNSLKNLFFDEEGMSWIDDEAGKLAKMLGEDNLAAAGGEAIGDIYGAFPELGWNKLVKTFLE